MKGDQFLFHSLSFYFLYTMCVEYMNQDMRKIVDIDWGKNSEFEAVKREKERGRGKGCYTSSRYINCDSAGRRMVLGEVICLQPKSCAAIQSGLAI